VNKVSSVALDISAVREHFSALNRELAFFDGPGGLRCRTR